MDFGDFLGPNGTEGTRKTRIVTGTLGAVAGGAIGAFAGNVWQGTTFAMVTHGAIGAMVGGFFAAVFSGLVILGLLIILAVVAAIAWQIFTDGG